jgi:hypothetical protein
VLEEQIKAMGFLKDDRRRTHDLSTTKGTKVTKAGYAQKAAKLLFLSLGSLNK